MTGSDGNPTYRHYFPDGFGNEEPNVPEVHVSAPVYPSLSLPGHWNKLVIWGLNGTLVNFPRATMDDAFQNSAVNVVAKMFAKKICPVTPIEVKELIHQSYTQTGIPTTLLADKLQIDESALYTEMLLNMESEFYPPNMRDLFNPDQQVMDSFEKSIQEPHHIVHMLLTNGIHAYGDRALYNQGIRSSFHRVAGTVAQEGKILHKRHATERALAPLLEGVTAERMQDIYVVDDDLHYLQNVKRIYGAVKTVLISRDFGNSPAKPEGIDYAVRHVLQVHQDVLGVNVPLVSRATILGLDRPRI